MDANLITHDLVQRMKEHERKIEQQLRDYPHLLALNEVGQSDHQTRAAGIGEWLREHLPVRSGGPTVNVNLHIAVVYTGAEPAGELVVGNERVEWNHLIDAVRAAVQSKLSAGRDNRESMPVTIFIK